MCASSTIMNGMPNAIATNCTKSNGIKLLCRLHFASKVSLVHPFVASFLPQYTISPFGKKPAGGSSSSMPYGGGLAGAAAAAPAAPAAAAPAPVAAAPVAAAGLSYGGLPVAPATKGKSYSPFGKKPAGGGSTGGAFGGGAGVPASGAKSYR